MKKTALFWRHQSMGVTPEEFSHTLLPTHFDSLANEYTTYASGAVLMDLGFLATVVVHGTHLPQLLAIVLPTAPQQHRQYFVHLPTSAGLLQASVCWLGSQCWINVWRHCVYEVLGYLNSLKARLEVGLQTTETQSSDTDTATDSKPLVDLHFEHTNFVTPMGLYGAQAETQLGALVPDLATLEVNQVRTCKIVNKWAHVAKREHGKFIGYEIFPAPDEASDIWDALLVGVQDWKCQTATRCAGTNLWQLLRIESTIPSQEDVLAAQSATHWHQVVSSTLPASNQYIEQHSQVLGVMGASSVKAWGSGWVGLAYAAQPWEGTATVNTSSITML